MLKFLIPFCIIFSLIQFYIYTKFQVFFSNNRRIFAIFWLLLSLTVILLIAKEIHQSFDDQDISIVAFSAGFIWLGFAFVLLTTFAIFDIAGVVIRLIGLKIIYRRMYSAPIIGILSIFALSVTIYGLYAAQQVSTTFVNIASDKIPSNIARIRIVQLSDIHLNPITRGAQLEKIVQKTNEQHPDIIVITGDTIERNMAGYQKESELLKQLSAKEGVYIIEGNHEHLAGIHQALDFLNKTGMTVLRNEIVELDHVILIGETDPARGFETPPPAPKIDYTTLRLPKDKFVVLLRHQPFVEEATKTVADLQLSGHTHKGQIWPFYWLTRLAYNYPANLSNQDGILLYISNGIGFWGPPIRVLADPQIVVIDLIPAHTISS